MVCFRVIKVVVLFYMTNVFLGIQMPPPLFTQRQTDVQIKSFLSLELALILIIVTMRTFVKP
jgi:hypothetical protein